MSEYTADHFEALAESLRGQLVAAHFAGLGGIGLSKKDVDALIGALRHAATLARDGEKPKDSEENTAKVSQFDIQELRNLEFETNQAALTLGADGLRAMCIDASKRIRELLKNSSSHPRHLERTLLSRSADLKRIASTFADSERTHAEELQWLFSLRGHLGGIGINESGVAWVHLQGIGYITGETPSAAIQAARNRDISSRVEGKVPCHCYDERIRQLCMDRQNCLRGEAS